MVDVLLPNIVHEMQAECPCFVDMGMFPYNKMNLKGLNRAWASLGGDEV